MPVFARRAVASSWIRAVVFSLNERYGFGYSIGPISARKPRQSGATFEQEERSFEDRRSVYV
jgi:hypothetical protein